MNDKTRQFPVSFHSCFKKNKTTVGSWITMAHPGVAEIMAKSGFDWLVIDMEHSAIEMSDAESLIRVIDLCGLPAMVRVGENDPNLIKRVMDCGASGVVVPMVNTPEQAEQAVKAVKYPPFGRRGVGLARAQGYGTTFEGYKEWVAKESAVIVQIEHIEAVRNIDAILSVKGVDGFIVGPYDLSGSLGFPGKFDHPEMLSALDVIKNAVMKSGKYSGFHVVYPEPDAALKKMKEGYSFLAFGVDFLFLGEMCRGMMSELNKKCERSL